MYIYIEIHITLAFEVTEEQGDCPTCRMYPSSVWTVWISMGKQRLYAKSTTVKSA
jgi:hypothetical protein